MSSSNRSRQMMIWYEIAFYFNLFISNFSLTHWPYCSRKPKAATLKTVLLHTILSMIRSFHVPSKAKTQTSLYIYFHLTASWLTSLFLDNWLIKIIIKEFSPPPSWLNYGTSGFELCLPYPSSSLCLWSITFIFINNDNLYWNLQDFPSLLKNLLKVFTYQELFRR